MESIFVGLASALAGAVAGGVVSYVLQVQKFTHQLMEIHEADKTEYMAETTVKHLLLHEGYTDRTFDAIEAAMGGFAGDELRRILVRAGAVRINRGDGREWWCLISREQDRIKKYRSRDGGKAI